jgi:hypothetical protein
VECKEEKEIIRLQESIKARREIIDDITFNLNLKDEEISRQPKGN